MDPRENMAEEVKKFLHQLLSKVKGLHCILITDRDGVPILKIAGKNAPEAAMRPNFISTFGLAIDQGSKLGIGKTKTLICSYSKYQLIQLNKLPLVVSFVASNDCNIGHILSLEQLIDPILNDLKAVAET